MMVYPLSFVFMLGFSFLMAVITGFKATLNGGDRASLYCSLTYGCLFLNCLFIVIDFDLGHFGYLSAGALQSTPALWFNWLTPVFMLFFYREFLDMKEQDLFYYRLITCGSCVLLFCVCLKTIGTFLTNSPLVFELPDGVFQFVLLGLFVVLPFYSLRFWKHPIYRFAAWSSWSIIIFYFGFLLFYFGGAQLPSWIGDNLLFTISVIDGILFWLALSVRDSRVAVEKNLFEKQAIANEMIALRLQMNPHFIFNSLNAIKSYNLNHDAERTDLYLTKFSRLVRQVLENSATEKITLENELNTLELYLEMEKLRAGEKLNYRIEISSDLEPRFVEIPPLLIQPYVENAIWHGLLHKEGGGTVTISVETLSATTLQVVISDDGIGRKAASLYVRTTERQSLGMKITAERIKHLSMSNRVGIEDLENPTGTKVTLWIAL